MKRLSALIVGLLAIGATALPAQAQYPGSQLILQETGNSLFNFVGNDAIEITGDVSGANQWFLSSNGGSTFTRLVGIRTIYLVNPDGSEPSSISIPANPNNGYVEVGQGGTRTNWNPFDSNNGSAGGYKGWDNGAPGKGFPDGSHWLVLADPTLAGKSASNTDTFGHFDFNTVLFENSLPKYRIGIDYILEGGQTARGYITSTTTSRVPEPGTLALLATGAMGALAIVRRRRSA